MKDIFCCFQGKELSKISCSEDYITVGPELIEQGLEGSVLKKSPLLLLFGLGNN